MGENDKMNRYGEKVMKEVVKHFNQLTTAELSTIRTTAS